MPKITSTYKTRHKRRRKKKTDYRARFKLVKSGKTRLVIRKSLSHIYIQFIEFNPSGDNILVAANTTELKKLGWNSSTGNIPSAYLIGLLSGKKAKDKKITGSILDIGLQRSTKGSRIYATLKGVIDSGINVNHDPKVFPSDKRTVGGHIDGFDVNNFEEVKKKIISG